MLSRLRKWFRCCCFRRRTNQRDTKCQLCLKPTHRPVGCTTCQAPCCRACTVQDHQGGAYCRWCAKAKHVQDDDPLDDNKFDTPLLDYSDVPVLEIKTAKMFLTSRQVQAVKRMASRVRNLSGPPR
ncbi:Aste57867_22469 [Aphanomyces stellatus]|uniref:Aste57867_22469 protein n=1 Tax=Aphanomyces stellatus TaxID=120398 RepID=A0A485LQ27_9STRA|nr:hypothetical protein As57867_022399 [Aphanomyces stellatus]VFT99129.1 Aste57867_22469 [Aphanomyces stellatus]